MKKYRVTFTDRDGNTSDFILVASDLKEAKALAQMHKRREHKGRRFTTYVRLIKNN